MHNSSSACTLYGSQSWGDTYYSQFTVSLSRLEYCDCVRKMTILVCLQDLKFFNYYCLISSSNTHFFCIRMFEFIFTFTCAEWWMVTLDRKWSAKMLFLLHWNQNVCIFLFLAGFFLWWHDCYTKLKTKIYWDIPTSELTPYVYEIPLLRMNE